MTAAGVPLWTKQGVAPADDAVTAAVTMWAGRPTVLGQFSDTIAFDQPYLNTWDDAMFLMKVDGNGQDQWFRRCGGAALNRGADLRWRAEGLFVLGELQGVMSFEDGTPDQVSELAPEGYFILRADEQGQFIAAAGVVRPAQWSRGGSRSRGTRSRPTAPSTVSSPIGAALRERCVPRRGRTGPFLSHGMR